MTEDIANIAPYLAQFKHCLQNEPPFCMSACPLDLKVYDFIDRIRENRFNAAYKQWRNAAGFPFIAARLCSGLCSAACPLGGTEAGEPVRMNDLERAVCHLATKTEPTDYNLPQKPQRIAIIGAGLAGMAAALRLATKRYQVTVYEKASRPGGTLYELMEENVFQDDFALQTKHLAITYRFDTEITSVSDLADDSSGKPFDAIFAATGRGGASFGIDPADPAPCRMEGETGLFLGGSLTAEDKMHALGSGLAIATAIDNFLMTRNLRYPVPRQSHIQIDEASLHTLPAVVPTGDNGLYTKEEAAEEAARCIKCQCNGCQLHDDLLRYLHKTPTRLRDEIDATCVEGTADIKGSPAKRSINMYQPAGLFREICPVQIDMDALIQAARFRIHKIGKMPWAFHEFFLKDMAFTNSAQAALCRKAPGENRDAPYAFFPGCQLGASAPALVTDTYRYLLQKEPRTGLLLHCCGVPAKWAGEAARWQETLDTIRTQWIKLGRPTLLMACPTCMKTFSESLPEIPTTFVYDFMAARGIEKPAACPDETMCIFDPCATRAGDTVRTSVRRLCRDLALPLEPLAEHERHTACCSYGGQGSLADPNYTRAVIRQRMEESDHPYITYCINCRDAFISQGKEARHILDLLFGHSPGLSTVTERRANRTRLKEVLLKEFWKESAAAESGSAEHPAIRLEMDETVRQKISSEHLLEEEVAQVIAFCERTKRSFYDAEKDSCCGCRKLGHLTCWVEYRPLAASGSYEVLNVYTHRMEIQLEVVWNGKRVDPEVQ